MLATIGRGALLALLVWSCLGGCGDDDGEDGTPDGGLDGGMLPADTSPPGSTPTTTPPTSSGPPPIMCGNFTCAAPGQDLVQLLGGLGLPLGGGIFPSPCCTDDDTCGLQLSTDAGLSCIPAPPPDPLCPSVQFFGTTVAGCCVEELGVCGVDTVQYGGGCEEYAGGLGPLFGMAEVPCGDGDAGAADAGATGDDDAGP